MLKPFLCIGAAIAYTPFLAESAIALPLPLVQLKSTPRFDANAPLCYIQFQGSSTIDVSNVCGKTLGEARATGVAVTVSRTVVPPVFDPMVMNASTTGQCNFVDANGNPCPQKQP